MKRISASKEKSKFWPGGLLAEDQILDKTCLEGSVWGVRTGKRTSETSWGHQDASRGPKLVKTGQIPKVASMGVVVVQSYMHV